jgi:hypothetical protein
MYPALVQVQKPVELMVCLALEERQPEELQQEA